MTKDLQKEFQFIHFAEEPLSAFPATQQVNLPACSPNYPFNTERQAGKL